MTKNRRTVPDSSRPASDDDSEESDGNGNGAAKGKSSEPNLVAPTPVRP